MAVVVVSTSMAAGVVYTHTTDSSVDWPSVPNDVYFLDLNTDLVYYKDPAGTVIGAYDDDGLTAVATDGVSIIGDGTQAFPLTAVSTGSDGNQLLSGGASYSGTGMVFNVSVLVYTIGGIQYTTPAVDVTLNTGDPSFSRFDAIVASLDVNDDPIVEVIEGVPASTPSTPTVGPEQVLVQYVLVGQNATNPTIQTEYIYRNDQSSDWNGTAPTINLSPSIACPTGIISSADFTSSTPSPVAGGACLLANTARYNNQARARGVKFSAPSPVSRDDYTVLSFYVNFPSPGFTQQGKSLLRCTLHSDPIWYPTVGYQNYYLGWVDVGNFCDLSLTDTWQLVNIPTSSFTQNSSLTTIGGIHFISYPSPCEEVYFALDEIKLQTGFGPSTNIATIDVLENNNVIAPTAKLNFEDTPTINQRVTNDSLTNTVTVENDVAINVINTLYVSKGGDDAVASIQPNNQATPFLTIGAAIALSSPGNTIIVSPGEYPEEGLDITGLSLVSTGGWENTTIGPIPSAATTTVITVGDQGYLQGFSVFVPANSNIAINCNQVSGTNSVYDVALYGDGLVGFGIGLNRTGGGKTIGSNIRVEGGGMTNAMKVDSGVLALEGIHIPQSAGTIDYGLLVTTDGVNAGRAQMIGFNCGSNNLTSAIRTEGGLAGIIPTALIFTPNIFNCINALSTDGVYQTSNLLGGRIENVTYAVNVDLAATGVGLKSSIYRITSNHQPNYLYNPEVAASSEFSLVFTQEPTSTFRSSHNIFGADQISAGFSEKGIRSSFGKGAPYSSGMVVLNATNAQIPNIQNGLADITAAALSKDNSTFGFQTSAANNAIYFGSQRKDELLNPLLFFGLLLNISTAATTSVLGNKDYVFETWDGTGWRIINAMSTSELGGLPYGNNHFLRSDSTEFIRPGLLTNVFYQPIGSFEVNTPSPVNLALTPVAPGSPTFDCYWLRVKTIVPEGGGVVYPTFEQAKLLDSSHNISEVGIPSGTGLAKLRKSINLSGRVWSGALTGGMTPGIDLGNYSKQVGDTLNVNWDHDINYSVIEQGDSISVQFPIPIGTCTAYPLSIKAVFEFESPGGMSQLGGDPVTLTARCLPQASSGNLVADVSGSKELVRRSYTQADLLVDTGSRSGNENIIVIDGSNNVIEGTSAITLWDDINTRTHEINLADLDISNYFENDVILLNIEYTADASLSTPIVPFTLIIEGIFHQDGAGV